MVMRRLREPSMVMGRPTSLACIASSVTVHLPSWSVVVDLV
ncbi:hypothetical protein ACFL09_01685 [Planctomycetota bacterium]